MSRSDRGGYVRRRLLSLTATILLTALLAAGLGVAWADEKTERTETGDPSIVVLEPGHNYVGWVAAPLSVDGLMRRIPEITAVRAWDALRQRSYTPTGLTAGMGVRISVEAGEAITWRRPTTPVRGLVELRPGQKVHAIPFKGRVELIPLEPIEAARGFVRGIDTDVPRDGDRT